MIFKSGPVFFFGKSFLFQILASFLRQLSFLASLLASSSESSSENSEVYFCISLSFDLQSSKNSYAVKSSFNLGLSSSNNKNLLNSSDCAAFAFYFFCMFLLCFQNLYFFLAILNSLKIINKVMYIRTIILTIILKSVKIIILMPTYSRVSTSTKSVKQKQWYTQIIIQHSLKNSTN